MGELKTVTIDDTLKFNNDLKTLKYAQPNTKDGITELWTPFIERAYAK